MTFQKMKFFPWDFQNFSLGNGKSKIPFSLGIPMMGIPRAETLHSDFVGGSVGTEFTLDGHVRHLMFLSFVNVQ